MILRWRIGYATEIQRAGGQLPSAQEATIIDWTRVDSQKARHTLGHKSEVTPLKLSPSLYREDGSILLSRGTKLWETQSRRQEEPRLSVPREFLVRTLDALQTHTHRHFCALIFTLDEMGASECEDRKSRSVIIRIDIKDYLIRHKVRPLSVECRRYPIRPRILEGTDEGRPWLSADLGTECSPGKSINT
jgi:hypothetical protein